MRQISIKVLLFLLLILAAIPALAEEVIVDGIKYSCDAETGTATVSRGVDCRGAVTIPESVSLDGEAYTVAGIDDTAFYGCKNITSVNIPESITQIGSKAFQGCTGLMSVTIPASITEIGNSAFYECTGLNRVYISDVAAWCVISFDDCYSNPLNYACKLYLGDELLTDLVIPDGVKYIGDYVFDCCSNLTSVIIPRTVMTIGKSAFSSCGLGTIICHAPVPPSCDCYYIDYNPDDYPSDFDFDFFKYSPFGSYLGSYNCDLNVPAASVDAYKEADVWRKFKNILPIGTTSVKEISDAEGAVSIKGNIVLANAEAGTPVNIYTFDGVLRYHGTGPAEVVLPAGTYIIRYGVKTDKIVVR